MEVIKHPPYQPADNAELDGFIDAYCRKCQRWKDYVNGNEDACIVLGRALIYPVDDANYPAEWCYVDGQPKCTAFDRIGEVIEHDH